MPMHTVRQGEYVASIAADYGFSDYRRIWNDPQNAALKAERGDPNVLLPGDQLFIPEKAAKEETAVTEKRNQFIIKLTPVKLRILLKDLDDNPIAGKTCLLRVSNDEHQLTTDDSGLIEQRIPPTTHDGSLILIEPESQSEASMNLKIGFLDPVEEVSGIQARLNNLGYRAGEIGAPDPQILQSAIEEFQCDHGLAVDGKCGSEMQKKLKEVYGC